jgi:L-lactate dehydrogenase complex protein LldG
LKEKGVALCDNEDPDSAFDADVGITGVNMAVAETPTLSLISGGNRRRLASLAAPCHISIVRAEQIVPDLLDWSMRDKDNLPASEILVSGPSKTADIELKVVHGVHGPREEHVIILD